MTPRHILITGAGSAIAQATARILAADGHALFLAGRNAEQLSTLAADLDARDARSVGTLTIDLDHAARHSELLDAANAHMGGLDTVLIAHGTLPDQTICTTDPDAMRAAIETNFTQVAALLTQIASRFEAQGHGTLMAISSVAGDRGRQSNYVYGAAKGALSLFLAGLRNRLYHHGVRVVTLKPGFVDTPMTQSFTKGPLWASPEAVAQGIVNALYGKGDVIYLPGFWRWIMCIIRLIPEPLFKRLKL